MHDRTLGHDAPAVSAVGFGAMPLSLAGRPDQDAAVSVIHAALDAGMTLIDTADVYCLDDGEIGHNERLVARALSTWAGGEPDSILVATKGGMIRPEGRWERDGRPEHLRAACERSLRALEVDRIDLYQFHAPDRDVPFADSVGELAELRAAGKVHWVGLSNVGVDQIEEARGIVEVVSVQNRLNPFFREALETNVVNYCLDNDIAFIAYSPVGGGRLNKRLPDHPVVRRVAGRHGISAHAAVLAWVLSKGSNVIAIPGARTVPHVVDSAGAAEVRLEEDDLRAIDEADFPTA